MSLFATLARPNILKLRAYRSARSIATEARIFLDANEAPGPVAQDLNRYPKPQPPELVQKFAKLYNVREENILVGRGSDEAIDVLTRTFCEPSQDEILITPPTYGMYEVSADIQNAGVKRVDLLFTGDTWKLNLPEMIRQTTANTKIIYLCSPNNPTGTVFNLDEVRTLLQSTNAIVVVDEAYGEFTPNSSVIPLLQEFPRLVVLRTLSKAWGRAGLRCGVALGHPELIELLQKVRAPYPLPQPIVELALEVLSPKGESEMRARVETLGTARKKMSAEMLKLPSVEKVFPSEANFLLVRFKNEAAVMAATKAGGILLRSRNSEPGLSNCVRITIGNEEENRSLMQVLGEIL